MASVLKFAHYIFHLCLWKGKAIKISDSNIERKKIRTQICGNQNSIAKKKRSLTSTALQHWTQIGECPVCTNCGRNMKHRSNRAMEEKVRNTYWFKIRRKLNTFRKRETQKKKANFSLPMPWRRIGGVAAQVHSFLTSALYGGKWSNSSCLIAYLVSLPELMCRGWRTKDVHTVLVERRWKEKTIRGTEMWTVGT